MKLLSPGDPPALSASELAWLRCFDAAARCASFTKAASELHISQSAVGQQVKKLEERLGHPLVLRTQAGLRLTREGEQLFAATRESFRGLESAVHRLHVARIGEPVNVSCSPSFAMFWLTLRLDNFYRAYPHLTLRVVGDSQHPEGVRISQESLAAAIRFELPRNQATDDDVLFDEWLVPVATPAFMQAHPEVQSVGDLRGEHLLHAADPSEGTEPAQEWATWLSAIGHDMPAANLRRGTQFNHSLLAMQAALGGQGVAMGRVALVLRYLLQGRLVTPFRQRVRLDASYRMIINAQHPEASTIRSWLRGEADVFVAQRDSLFDSEHVETV
ncbi:MULTISPECIES: LysR family transcriptional regulator [Cupriavidus]|nr:LysR family transcriptional regulator [Cupriavidus pauculus]